MLEAVVRGALPPTPKAHRLKRFPHAIYDLFLGQTGDFLDFFEGNAICPSSPNDPIGTTLGWLRFLNSCNGYVGLFWFHKNNHFINHAIKGDKLEGYSKVRFSHLLTYVQ